MFRCIYFVNVEFCSHGQYGLLDFELKHALYICIITVCFVNITTTLVSSGLQG